VTADSAEVLAAARTAAARKTYRIDDTDWAAVAALVGEVTVAHVAFVAAGQPFVIPIAAAVDGRDVLLHGSTGSRWLRQLAAGVPISLAVTALDGLIVARSAFESSMRYRSAVLFGRCSPVDEADKSAAVNLLTEAFIPGRVAEVRASTAKELAATLVLRMTVEDFTLKVSDGWPDDPETDVAGTAWAGVVPTARIYRAPVAAPDLAAGVAIPPSVTRLG
jgi:uncharacterized protein